MNAGERLPRRIVAVGEDEMVTLVQVLGDDDAIQLGADLKRLAAADPQHAPVRAEADR